MYNSLIVAKLSNWLNYKSFLEKRKGVAIRIIPNMRIYGKGWLKYVFIFMVCLLVRLIPFRAPNIEPLMAAQMPLAKNYGSSAAFLFAFLSIVLYDVITSRVGIWTFLTATAYGLVGIWAFIYFIRLCYIIILQD